MSVELSRTVRLVLPLDDTTSDSAFESERSNAFAAWPSPTAAGPGLYVELEATVAGEPDRATGYLIGIQHVDAAVRAGVRRTLVPLTRVHADPLPLSITRLARAIDDDLPLELTRLRWNLTPRHTLVWVRSDSPEGTTTMPDSVLWRERFEFSAAHRLHVDDRDADWNREFFGKCNNPAGHGHNYEFEVEVRATVGDDGTARPSPLEIERIVDEIVVERFDHTHLNEDVDDFRERIPSVEHIAKRIRELLAAPIADAGGALTEVTVWETGKTSCTVRG